MSIAEQAAKPTVAAEDVLAAAQRIQILARKTPIETSRLFNQATGVKAYLKCENLQRGGAFKIRGATNFLSLLTETERRRGIVTFSSGNHAQAVAIAAAHFAARATIVMPADAPKSKLESTRAYSPEIVFYDRQRENREEIAQHIVEKTGAVVLPPYDHPWIIAGQGTTALEMLRERPDLDAIVAPLGGGGLLSGIAVAAKAMRPDIRIFGVEPEFANDWYLSLQRGVRVEIASPPTIADGLRTLAPGKVTFPIVQTLVDGVLLVSEDEIKSAMRFLLTRTKMLVEPSGAVAAAAVLQHKLPAGLRAVGVVISGGNVDLNVLADICDDAS